MPADKKPAPVDVTTSQEPAATVTKPEVPEMKTTHGKWQALYTLIHTGTSLNDALTIVGWHTDMEPREKRDWKVKRDARATAIQKKIAAGEQPFAEGTKELALYKMLKAGCTDAELKAKFNSKGRSIGNQCSQLAALVGGDLVRTSRKGVTSFKLEE